MRSANSENKRRTIIEAAISVVAREGVHGTTTRKIAAAAHINLATLHYHFKNKDAVLLNMLSHIVETARNSLMIALDAQETLEQRIASMLNMIWSEVRRNPDEQITLYNLTLYALSAKGQDWLAKRKYENYLQLYRDGLANAADVANGSNKADIDALANFMFTSNVGIILQWLATQDAERAGSQVATTIALTQAMARQASG
ncbi:TetR/AcrR family transcriptional regulator [Novosphingobium beihaiensis]|uniref:TetR family transcriptional regulator n=1 Tax=Novosphingobium beihaiensis TaxID=2930389 RepID=A0ABT0BLY3_9SPHN|nr:TetR family transcriptional regulator [Novosphingobium beihaiensis]MCJ2185836.1 TetR family transcriptional regulator [Novosphingobium beihaiensis]